MNIMQMRRGMGGGDGIVLPPGYTRLDHVSSNGNAYIDTGIAPTDQLRWDINMKFDVIPTASTGMGLNDTVQGFAVRFHICWFSSMSGGVNYPTYSAWRSNEIVPDYQKNCVIILPDTAYHNYIISKEVISIDNNEVYPSIPLSPTSPYHIMLFARSNANSIINKGKMSIRRSTMYNNGVKVQDLIPARNSSNVYGLYDIVTGTFFTSPVGGLSGE